MKILIRFWLLVFIIAYPLSLLSQSQWSLSELNLAHQYDPGAEIFLKYQPLVEGDSLNLLVQLEINQDKPQLYDYSFDLFLLNSVDEKLTLQEGSVTKDSLFLASQNKVYWLKFKLKYSGQKWAVIKANSNFSGFSFYFEVPLHGINLSNFTIENDFIEISNYLQPGTYRVNKNVTVFYYNHPFTPAVAPMVTKAPLPGKTMNIDSVFTWQAGLEQSLSHQGLYYFQTDTTTTKGRGIVMAHKYFPKPATLEQLKDPLIYITTLEEREKIEAIETKLEFDQFWLDLTESPERAKIIIREFYDRVEMANRLFTSFKEGWKTDPGMIYIIFGVPDEVIKQNQSETWVYLSDARLPKVKFEFIRSNNIFSSTHYSLIRDKDYSPVWFRAIDLWRKSRF